MVTGFDSRRGIRLLVLPALVLVFSAVAVGTSYAKIAVRATVETSASKSRLVVTIVNSSHFTSRNKPRGVNIAYKRKTYKLRHVAGTAATRPAAGQTSSWRSSLKSAFNGVEGRRILIRERTRAGTKSFTRRVSKTVPPSVPAPVSPAPAPPATDETRNRFLTMFNDSGWDRAFTAPTPQQEPMEDLYNFCADGRYFEHFTNGVTGSDTYHQGTWQLSDVKASTVLGYNVVEGLLFTTDEAAQLMQLSVALSEQAPNIGFINGEQYMRVGTIWC